MASTTQRYPLATADGKHIPLEVIKPVGLHLIDFLSASASAQIAIPADTEILVMQATEDCVVVFGTTASLPVGDALLANALFVPATIQAVIAPPAATFSVIGLSADGLLAVQLVAKWAGLGLNVQTTKG